MAMNHYYLQCHITVTTHATPTPRVKSRSRRYFTSASRSRIGNLFAGILNTNKYLKIQISRYYIIAISNVFRDHGMGGRGLGGGLNSPSYKYDDVKH